MNKVTSLREKIRGTRILTKPVRMAQPGGQSPDTPYVHHLSSLTLRTLFLIFCTTTVLFFISGCKNKSANQKIDSGKDSSFVNTDHLEHLLTPVIFSDTVKALGVYIYAEAPDYRHVTDSDEGFTCVDDVARAALIYLRHKNFSADTSIQNKVTGLIRFILEMQSPDGYFYNFLFPGNVINKTGKTSSNAPNWWSWRALQTLTEASPSIKRTNPVLAEKIDSGINKLIIKIKSEVASFPLITKKVKNISVPQWLPAGSGTDQASILMLALINYCAYHYDRELKNFIRNLADGIAMMQHGNEGQFPYSCFLSWENIWHAYGSDQAYALMRAGRFLNESGYINKAKAEVDNFYPWLLKSGMRSSFSIVKKEKEFVAVDEKQFPQIAYGIRPMIFAAAEAYELTGQQKYADIAGLLAAWFFGANDANQIMYDKNSGRCFDGIVAKDSVNKNSGAESTIECLLALQKIEAYPAIISAMNKYKRQ